MRGYRVHVLATELNFGDHEPSHPCNATITHWSKMTAEEMKRDYDVIIVNVGDHYLYHAGIFWITEAAASLGIFHDYYLYDLFNGWLWDEGKPHDAFWRDASHDRIVAETYGLEAQPLARLAREGALPLESIAQKLPMTEWIARRCSGAFGHSHFYQERLRKSCAGPVDWARLPAFSRQIPPASPRFAEADDTVVVLTVGIMNANKCADLVIEAIGGSPALSRRVEYRLVGPISTDETQRLTQLADSLGYGGLRIFGHVDDEALDAHLTRADIICCLRRPVLEGASASAVEALQAGRPLIVANAGFYAELPDEVLFKVPADVPIDQLRARLECLVVDEALRLAAGAVARDWAETHLSLDHYLNRLETFIHEAIEAGPLLRLGHHVGANLTALGLNAQDEAIPRIARSLDAIMG